MSRNLPISRENTLKVEGGVDVCGDDVSEYEGVLAVQHERAVQNVEEEVDVAGGGEVARHRLEHARDQTYPPGISIKAISLIIE